MAEIKDIYSLEFDSSGFESALQNAIAQIQDLNANLEDSTEQAEEAAGAFGNLQSVLKTEATTIDDLNSKRNALVKTSNQLNQNSKEANAVNSELSNTNKRLATTTAEATTRQRGLFSTLVRGSRSINSVRRSVSLLNGALRALGGIGIFTLVLQGLQALGSGITDVARRFGLLRQETVNLTKEGQNIAKNFSDQKNRLDELFVALDNANQGSEEQAEAIRAINKQYPELLKNGQLDITTQQGRAEAYRLATIQIAQAAIEQERITISQQAQQEVLQKAIERTLALQEVQRIDQEAANGLGLNAVNLAIRREAAVRRFNQAQRELNQTREDANNRIRALTENESDFVRVLTNTITGLEQAGRSSQGLFDTFLNGVANVNNLTDGINQTEEALRKTTNSARGLNQALNNVVDGSVAALRRDLADLNRQLEQEIAADTSNEARIRGLIDQIRAQEQALREAQEIIDRIRREGIPEGGGALTGGGDLATEFRERLQEQFQLGEEFRQLRQAQVRAQLGEELILLERERQQAVNAARARGEDVEAVNEEFNNRRAEAEREAQRKILEAQIEGIRAQIRLQEQLGAKTTELQAKLNETLLELVELDNFQGEATLDIKTEDGQDPRNKVFEIVDAAKQALDQVANVISAINERIVAQLDENINRSKSALDNIKQNSEEFNAEQLALEQERLENLERERARAVERQRALAIVQIAIDTAIAVAKAASQTGVAAPIAIAGVIAAIAGGIASAASVASGAAFYEGTEYVDKQGRYPSGRDKVPAMLNRGEAVITTQKNRQYRTVLHAIHNGKIPAESLNSFASNYMKGGGFTPSVMSSDGPGVFFVNTTADYSELKAELKEIKQVLTDLPKFMPRTTVKGNTRGIIRVFEERSRRAQFASNRAK